MGEKMWVIMGGTQQNGDTWMDGGGNPGVKGANCPHQPCKKGQCVWGGNVLFGFSAPKREGVVWLSYHWVLQAAGLFFPSFFLLI